MKFESPKRSSPEEVEKEKNLSDIALIKVSENYLSKKMDEWSDKNEEDPDAYEEYEAWQTAFNDLSVGNYEKPLSFLETYRGNTLDHSEEAKENRTAILGISKKLNPNINFMSKEQISNFLNDEYEKRLKRMHEEFKSDSQSEDYSEEERNEYERDVINWQEQSNQIVYGSKENSAKLIESEIRDLNDFIEDEKNAIREIRKTRYSVNKEEEEINEYDERIRNYKDKLNKYRKVRDSLYTMILET